MKKRHLKYVVTVVLAAALLLCSCCQGKYEEAAAGDVSGNVNTGIEKTTEKNNTDSQVKPGGRTETTEETKAGGTAGAGTKGTEETKAGGAAGGGTKGSEETKVGDKNSTKTNTAGNENTTGSKDGSTGINTAGSENNTNNTKNETAASGNSNSQVTNQPSKDVSNGASGGSSSYVGTGGSGDNSHSSDPVTRPTACSHNWNDGTIESEPGCEYAGSRIFGCTKCGEVYREMIAAMGHEIIIDYGYPASCTQTGLSEGSHCGRCGKVFVSQHETETIDHIWSEERVWVSGYLTCYCGLVFYDADSYFAHFKAMDIAMEHGCVSTPGYEKGIYTCEMCGMKLNDN